MRRNWRWCLQRRWLFAFLATVCSADRTVIACVGDSITYGGGDSKGYSYPFRLQESLGSSSFSVLNFGESGATVSPTVDQYQEKFSDTYEDALESGADVFVIQLGTNDAKTKWWNATTYRASMNAFLDTFVALPQVPKLVLSVPPPYVYYDDSWDDVNANAINAELPTIVPEIAKVRGIPYANNYKAFGGLENFNEDYYWLPYDGIHPNPSGYERIAWEIYQTLRENYFPDITYVPTYRPTLTPTSSPSYTHRPTHIPVPHPTPAPSYHPTYEPTLSPSTAKPSRPPTPKPSYAPSYVPTTARPTRLPTVHPTPWPTPKPIPTPTQLPSANPTMAPNPAPTSAVPSIPPSWSPTPLISPKPSTVSPSSGPTLAPSLNPTTSSPSTPGPSSTIVQVTVASAVISGIVADEFGAAEARAFEVAVEETMDLPQGTVTVVTPATSNSERRRLLQETTVVFEIVSSIPVIRVGEDLERAVESGQLTAELRSRGSHTALADATIDEVAFDITRSPSAIPLGSKKSSGISPLMSTAIYVSVSVALAALLATGGCLLVRMGGCPKSKHPNSPRTPPIKHQSSSSEQLHEKTAESPHGTNGLTAISERANVEGKLQSRMESTSPNKVASDSSSASKHSPPKRMLNEKALESLEEPSSSGGDSPDDDAVVENVSDAGISKPPATRDTKLASPLVIQLSPRDATVGGSAELVPLNSEALLREVRVAEAALELEEQAIVRRETTTAPASDEPQQVSLKRSTDIRHSSFLAELSATPLSMARMVHGALMLNTKAKDTADATSDEREINDPNDIDATVEDLQTLPHLPLTPSNAQAAEALSLFFASPVAYQSEPSPGNVQVNYTIEEWSQPSPRGSGDSYSEAQAQPDSTTPLCQASDTQDQ